MTEREIFVAAFQRTDPVERGRYLEEACGSDAELRRRVENLLGRAEGAGSFLESPAANLDPTAVHSPSEAPGTQIGPYKLLEQIGEGGMGVVYLAQQTEPVKRLVALKVIKAGMDSRQVLARFEAERQALALMDHPNIARVLDAGTTGERRDVSPPVDHHRRANASTLAGRPYFVMELVKGVPITRYCDERKLTPRERLELFLPVCHAIQHAHQKGIIHRDIKPTNVLVALYDGKPVPKVIDFGVAKAAGQPLTEKTLVTGLGALVGTPEYMSPEQAELNQLDIDTRSDVYSLGVLLYELLTGTTPLTRKRVKDAALLEVLRVIREEEPQKPSTRLSTTEELPSIAANRGTEPARLSRLVRGELDWVVMKALEKDRNRRYETANSFAMDVQRYLADEPVQACPPSAAYRLRKFVRRNKGAVVAVASILVLLATIATIGSVAALRLAEEQQATHKQLHLTQQAERNEREANWVSKFQLFQAKLAHAKSNRSSGRVGQRFDSLSALREAVELARELGLGEGHVLALRNEAIACLALADLKVTKECDLDPHWRLPFAVDPGLEHYVAAERPLSAGNHGHLSVRRVDNNKEVARLRGFGVPVVFAEFSPDGRFVAAHYDGNGKRFNSVWDLKRPEPETILAVPADLQRLHFSPDGRLVATVQMDKSIRLYELPSGKHWKDLPIGQLGTLLSFHPDSRKLAVASGQTVSIHALDDGQEPVRIAHPPSARVRSLAWRGDGSMLATGCYDAQVYVWDMRDLRQPVQVLRGHQGIVARIAFNHRGDLLVTQSWDRTTRLWNPLSGKQLLGAPEYTAYRFSPDDRLLAWASDATKTLVWELASGRECRTLPTHKGPITTLASRGDLSPDGRLLISTGEQGARLWNLAANPGVVRDVATLPTGRCVWALFHPDGRSVITAARAGLQRWPFTGDPASGELRIGSPEPLGPQSIASTQLGGEDSGVMALCADGRTIAVVPRRGQALIFDLHNPDGQRQLKQNLLLYPAFSADGSWIATGTRQGFGVKIWEAQTGKWIKDLPSGDTAVVAFSPDGKWLAVASDQFLLWHVGSWEPAHRVSIKGRCGGMAFTRDGKMLAAQQPREGLRLFDPATDREFATLPTIGEPSCFSADGSLLVTSGENQTLQVWDLGLIRHQLGKLGLDWD
jgi:eukaryotic-like serine/threonine-protein kinase